MATALGILPLHGEVPGKIPVQPGDGRAAGFTLLDGEATGIRFGPATFDVFRKSPLHITNPGLAAGDVDGDGFCDLIFCRIDGTSTLFRNLGGWKFEDITEKAGLDLSQRPVFGAVLADVDGDGDLDLFLLSVNSRSSLHLNDGRGHFTEQRSFPWRRSDKGGDVSAALADIDGDGDLDLYTSRYPQVLLKYTMPKDLYQEMVNEAEAKLRRGEKPSKEFQERFLVVSSFDGVKVDFQFQERGEADALYLNDGRGNFRLVTDADQRFHDEDGKMMPMPEDWGLGAMFRDIDQDGDPDLYVCNDFLSPDRLWINDGTGRFRLAPPLTLRRTSWFSMGVDFADIDRDGDDDFFVVDMLSRSHTRRKTQMGDMMPTPIVIGRIQDRPQFMQNTLFLNRGDGTYAEIGQHAGLKASEWSWCPIFMDVDLDGYEDLLISTGMEHDLMDSDAWDEFSKVGQLTREKLLEVRQKLFPTLDTRNFIFRNQGDLTFSDKTEDWGWGTKTVSGGMAVADFDNDGDLDVVVNNLAGYPIEVYRNEATAPRIAVRLQGRPPNTQGIGARIRVVGGDLVQSQEVIAGGYFASGSDSLRVFAAPGGAEKFRLEVVWRNGRKTVVEEAEPNHIYEIGEAGAEPAEIAGKEPPMPLFVDESGRLDHRHQETPFDDFKRQPLLPNRLSQLGPGMAWFDVDRDGDDDLVIAGGRGGRLHVLVNDGEGGFQDHASPPLTIEQTAVVGFAEPDGGSTLLAGLSHYEGGKLSNPSAQGFSFDEATRWHLQEGLPGFESSTGPLALADIDGDGDLDLFVGGRVIPGRYPEPASSRIFLNQNGKWVLDPENTARFEKIGLVSGAVFGDLDDDGDADLVLAIEWGPVRIFRNDSGTLSDVSGELGTARLSGWWNGVTLGDFNGDGRLDIVASNWGRNSKYEYSYSMEHPLQIFYGDLDGTGTLDVVEAHFDKKMGMLVPERGRSCSSRAMPFVAVRNPTFKTFGLGSLQDVYGPSLNEAESVSANTLDHTVFLNTGDGFESRPLPFAAQISTGFGLGVADFDGDGNQDIFMSQNFFSVQNETPRNDGGRGVLLKGKGNGEFAALPGQESGVLVYGEQRGSALADFDRDGRTDIVVSQNGARTRLLRNVRGKPGLRVRLEGPASNPTGVGAVVRLEFASGKGPASVITAGSGYCSQDSAAKVLAVPEPPRKIIVRWPDGDKIVSEVPHGAREVVVDAAGGIRRSL